MAGGGRDVNAIWEQLRQQSAAPRRGGGLSGLAGLPGVTSRVRTIDKNAAAQPTARPSFIAQLGQGPKSDGAQQQAGGDHQALLASLQRDINGLSDPDRSTRRRAVEKLHAALLGGGGGAPPPEALQAALAGPLLVPLVRLLADPAEKCRELAAAFFAAALPRLPAPGGAAPLLPTLVPALADRVGSPPVQEPSEELRLALAELVAGPLLEAAPAPLPAELLPPLCATLCCQLADAYADIKKAACTSVARLAALAAPAAPAALPPPLLAPLVQGLAANLAHQHSRVRLASLQALHALVQGGMPQALMEEAVLPAVRPLAADHAPAVRAALFACAAQWAGSQLAAGASSDDNEGRAANQCRAFLPLLLPLLLLGLTDEAEATRSDSHAQLEAIGACMAGSSGNSSQGGSSMAVDGTPQQLPGYCHPFGAGRPSPAARRLVQAHLARLLQQALAELREWTATLRVAAARLLRAGLIYGEDEAAPLLPSVLQALHGAVGDDDAGVVTQAVGCAHVIGVNLPPRQWAPLAAELVAAEQQSAARRTAALVVLAALLHAAAKAGVEADGGCVQLVASTLCSPQLGEAAAAADGGPLQQQLLAACFNLLQWAGPAVTPVAPQLFQLLLRLWAIEAAAALDAAAEATARASAAADALTAAAVLDRLAAAVGQGSAADLCAQYGPALLSRCLQSAQQWTHAHPDWAALSALLRLSGALALAQLLPLALPALQAVAADHERDPRLSLGLLQLAAALLEDDSKAAAWLQPAVGQPLVRAVLLPALVWWAGRVAAAARYAALVAAATLLGKQRLPAEQLVQLAAEGAEGSAAGGASASQQGLLGRIAGCLDEEYEPETRQLACHALQLLLESVGPQLPASQLAALQPELLRRLDDSSNRVRVAACSLLQAWLAALLVAEPGGSSGGGGLVDADAASMASSMLIHLDDPDDEVAGAAGAVLEQLAAARPAAVRPLAAAAVVQAGRRPMLERVLAACG